MRIIKKADDYWRYNLQRLIQKKYPPQKGGVLVFHEVTDEPDTPMKPDYAIRTDEFTTFIDSLREKKAFFGRFDEEAIKPGKIYITFDDGFKSLLHTAIPVLEKREIQYIVFVPTDYIGKPGYVTKEELSEILGKSNSVIGGHSKSHRRMHGLRLQEIKDEITGSKKELEDIIERPVEYFAYPYGSMNAIGFFSKRAAKNAGYRYAFSTLCVDNRKYKDPFFYPRITVTSNNYKQILEMM